MIVSSRPTVIPEGQLEMFFAMKYGVDGRLYALRSTRIDVEDGATSRSYPLEAFGWATLELSANSRFAYAGNFFDGVLAKIDLRSGAASRLEFIFTLGMALKCYPLQPGGLLAIEAVIIGLTTPQSVYQETVMRCPSSCC